MGGGVGVGGIGVCLFAAVGGGVGVDFLLIAGNEEVEEVDEVAADVIVLAVEVVGAAVAAVMAEGVGAAPVELFAITGPGEDDDLVLGIAEVRKVCGFLVDVDVEAFNLAIELVDPFLVKGRLDRRVAGGVIKEDGFAADKGGECIITFSTAINRPDFAGHVKYLLLKNVIYTLVFRLKENN